MKIVALQFDIVWEDKAANFEKVRGRLTEASPEKGSLVALPEMFATGFSMNADAVAEPYGGGTERFLASTAKEFGIWLVAGAAMRGRDGQVRNKALVFSPAGELIAFYAKMRPFTPGGEPEHYVAGERPIAFPWADCMVSPFICYDLRFPEIFREAVGAHRPELFIVIANWPEKRIRHWVTLLRARAMAGFISVPTTRKPASRQSRRKVPSPQPMSSTLFPRALPTARRTNCIRLWAQKRAVKPCRPPW